MKGTIKPYRAKDGWRWRAKTKGRIVAESGEAYARKGIAVSAAKKYGPPRFTVVVAAGR